MNVRVKTLGRVAAALFLITGLAMPAAAQQTQPRMCADMLPQSFVLAAPIDGSSAIPVNFKTIYVAIPGAALATLPSTVQERVLLVDDAGATTEAGVLHPATRDDLPNDLPNIGSPAVANIGALTFSYTWVPALRASTHYTAVLARLDENNCVFAKLGSFSTATS